MVGFDMSLDGILCRWGKGISFHLTTRELLFELIYLFSEYINLLWEFLLGERICWSALAGVLYRTYFLYVNLIATAEFGEYRPIECICEIFVTIIVPEIVASHQMGCDQSFLQKQIVCNVLILEFDI